MSKVLHDRLGAKKSFSIFHSSIFFTGNGTTMKEVIMGIIIWLSLLETGKKITTLANRVNIKSIEIQEGAYRAYILGK